MKIQKITPALVERDENGYWAHPKYIAWFKDSNPEDVDFVSWAESVEMEVDYIELEIDVDFCSRAGKRWFSKGYEDISEWEPSMPAGEGWFIVSIHDTGDGPVCVWLREAK
ncbi:hypothetical protein ACLEDU_02460 [Lonsdalea quercina]|uniref:hypothetical protein n=1 Tax=Lonsdalea quercina TaxID=71657 RepID=UPI0039747731